MTVGAEHRIVSRPGPLRHLLGEWVQTLNVYCRRHDWKDVPWWCTERAAISILAAAAWRLGGSALEEYSVDKHHLPRTRPRFGRKGRQDLYFRLGSKALVCEAKHAWCNLGGHEVTWRRRFEDLLSEAKQDSRGKKHGSYQRLALLFVSPIIDRSRLSEVDKRIATFQGFVGVYAPERYAWFFPRRARSFPQSPRLRKEGGRFSYPGAAVFLEEVR